jgi:hypothetical protein
VALFVWDSFEVVAMEELLVLPEAAVEDGELTNSFDSNAAPMESATNREIAAASAALERPRLSLGRWFLTIISVGASRPERYRRTLKG